MQPITSHSVYTVRAQPSSKFCIYLWNISQYNHHNISRYYMRTYFFLFFLDRCITCFFPFYASLLFIYIYYYHAHMELTLEMRCFYAHAWSCIIQFGLQTKNVQHVKSFIFFSLHRQHCEDCYNFSYSWSWVNVIVKSVWLCGHVTCRNCS